jgi:ketosteroid isomerase-like protein
MSRNLDRVLRGYEAFNRRDIDAALEGLSPDIVWVGPTMLPEGEREFRGHAGVLDFWNMWHSTFEEFRAEIEETIDAGDQVMVMVRIHARHRDSGAEVVNPSFPHVWTIRDGEVVRMEMFQNRAAGLAAIGQAQEQVR